MNIMESWGKFDPADVLLRAISKPYKAYDVKKAAARVPSGEEAEAEGEEAGQRVASQAPLSIVVFVFVVASEEGEKECCASDSQAPKPGRQPSAAEEDLDQAWTKEQREEVTAKKAQEAEAAASVGLRRSPRARVPTEKVLK
ncbi:hypothetical protein Q7P36_011362 [Cladosporium allicinum]